MNLSLFCTVNFGRVSMKINIVYSGDVIPSKFNYILIVGLMLLIGLALVSTTLQIIQKQIHALADVRIKLL